MTADQQYMLLALREAEKSAAMGEIPIGCVLVWQDTVIACTHNLREYRQDATAHAEILAIQEGCRKLSRWRLTGCTLYVTIEPCPMCAGAIFNARIDRLVYGARDEKAGAVDTQFHICSSPKLNHRVSVSSGVCEEQCRQVMREFFLSRRDKKEQTPFCRDTQS